MHARQVRGAGAAGGEEGAGLARARARLQARAEQEEELMARVLLSRGERQGLKQARRGALAGGALLDDFADDIAGLVQARARAACMHAPLTWPAPDLACLPVAAAMHAVRNLAGHMQARALCACA
jgi:hypothetical protein